MNDISCRSVTLADAASIADIYRPYVENTAVSFEYTAPTAEEIARRIEKTTAFYPYFVAVKNGRVVGYAYAGRCGARRAYDRSAELSIYIDKNERGRGIGKMLYELLETELGRMGVINLYALIAAPFERTDDPYVTDSSLRFHEKLGYGVVGRQHGCGFKFGRWYDIITVEKFIGAHSDAPAPVSPTAQNCLEV